MAVFKAKETTKDGRMWYFSTYYVDLDGVNKKKKSKKYELKKDAQEAERIFLLTYKEQSGNDMTFEDLKLDYNNFQKDKVKITTFKNYPKFNKKIETLNKVKLANFNISHFNIWKNKFAKEDLSTIYKNNTYKYLRALINFAIKYHSYNNLIPILNKMTGFNNPNELKKEMKFYTYNEFIKFINEEKNIKYKCYFEMLYYCGLRKGEANALNWKDIDLKKGLVNINKNVTLKIKGEQYVILPTKTQSSNRILPLPKTLLDDLKILYNEFSKYSNFENGWFVFGGPAPLPDTTVQKHRDRNSKKVGFTIRVHDFRHSCASLLISNGASITLVAKYLGHSNIATTLNTYTHLFKNEFGDIIKVINNLKN